MPTSHRRCWEQPTEYSSCRPTRDCPAVGLGTEDTQWTWNSGEGVASAPHVVPGVDEVVVGLDHRAVGLDVRTGEKLWEVPSEGPVFGVGDAIVIVDFMSSTTPGADRSAVRLRARSEQYRRGLAAERRRIVDYRYLGNSGLKVSEITYGNWLTHGSQVENDIATKCVHAALEAGVTTFDTADVYANTKAEQVLGDALQGQRRESLEIFTKVFNPTGPKGPNDSGLSRKHIMESINGSLRRLGTDYVDLYQAHRFDYETPLEETMQAFADIVRQGKALYIGVSEWRADQIRAAHALSKEMGFQLISNQPQYNMLWRIIEAEVIPASQELGISQIVWSPIAQGVLTGKYKKGQPLPAGSRATDEAGGARAVQRYLSDDYLDAVAQLEPIAADLDLTMAQLAIAWVLSHENVASALVGASRPEQIESNVQAAGVKLDSDVLNRIDEAIGHLAERDPAKTVSPETRPS